MGKLLIPLFMLFLSVFLTSSLAIRTTNPNPQRYYFNQCMQRCLEHGTGGSKGQQDCRHECRKCLGQQTGLSLLDDDNQGRECEMVCEKHGNEPWKCKKSCKEIDIGDLQLDDNQGRQCEMVCEKHGTEPWKCKRSCKEIDLGDLDFDENTKDEDRQCEMVCEKHGYEPWKCKRSCKNIELGDLELADNQARECEMVCGRHGSEPWKCKRSCKGIELGENPSQGQQCETVCERHGSQPWECKTCCKQIELGDLDLERFAECQQQCLGKGGDKCLRRCVQESESERRGGSIIDLVQQSC